MVQPIPDGFHSITPHLVVTDAAKALAFYKKAFDAEELCRMPMPDGRLMHAEIKIGDSIVMMADCFSEMGQKSPTDLGASTVVLNLYVADCDKTWKQAIAAGAKERMPLMDAFWGDRYGQLTDPFGHIWGISTHKEDLSSEETMKRAQQWMAQSGMGPK